MSVVEWLESPEGEAWSKSWHHVPDCGNQFVSIRNDDGRNYAFLWYS